MNLEIQRKLYNLFNSSLDFAFYDGLKNENYPYGSFGYSTVNQLNTKTTKGSKIFLQLDLFSNKNGSKEVKQMANAVINILEEPFFIEQKECILDYWSLRVQREEEIYHGILEIEYLIY